MRFPTMELYEIKNKFLLFTWSKLKMNENVPIRNGINQSINQSMDQFGWMSLTSL